MTKDRTGAPRVTEMKVIPVAGQDSMLLNLSGAHAPYFTRNLVDPDRQRRQYRRGRSAGRRENPPDPGRRARPGDRRRPGHLEQRPERSGPPLRRPRFRRAGPADLRPAHHGACQAALECALLDLLGQHLDVPVCALLGEGQQRDAVEMLGYLFFIGDRKKTNLPYRHDQKGDAWIRVRDEEALTPDAIVRTAEAAYERYGFNDFKLKGGVLAGARRNEGHRGTGQALSQGAHHPRPQRRLVAEGSDRLVQGPRRCAGLCRGPLRRGSRLFRARDHGGIPPRHRPSHRHQHDRHRLAPDGACHRPGHRSTSRWPIRISGPCAVSVRVAQICADRDLRWGSHSNNHFDVSLAMFTHVAAAAPGNITAIDTHWIWQDGQRLTREPFQIKGGLVAVPARGGLGRGDRHGRSREGP